MRRPNHVKGTNVLPVDDGRVRLWAGENGQLPKGTVEIADASSLHRAAQQRDGCAESFAIPAVSLVPSHDRLLTRIAVVPLLKLT